MGWINLSGLQWHNGYVLCVLILICYIQLGETQLRKAPKDTYVIEGGTTLFRCAIRRVRYGLGEVSWNYKVVGLRGQQNISSEYLLYPSLSTDRRMRYSIVGNRSNGEYNLRITNMRESDQATYECVYFQGNADPGLVIHRKRAGVLTIGRPPDPGFPLCEMSPATGVLPLMNITVTCTTTGGAPRAKVRWYHGTKWIGKWAVGQIKYSRFLTANDVGIVLSCQEDHPSRPRYPRKCEVNPLKALEAHVKPGPDVSVRTGTNIIFTCVPNQKGHFGYMWSFNNEPIIRSEAMYVFGNSGEKLRVIGIAKTMHNSKITCQSTDTKGYTTRANTFLSVVDTVPPTIPPTVAAAKPPVRPNPRPNPRPRPTKPPPNPPSIPKPTTSPNPNPNPPLVPKPNPPTVPRTNPPQNPRPPQPTNPIPPINPVKPPNVPRPMPPLNPIQPTFPAVPPTYPAFPMTTHNPFQNPWNPGQNNPQNPFNPMQPQQPQSPFNPNQPQSPFNPQQPQSPFNPNQPQRPFNPNQPQRPFNPQQPQSPFNPNQPQRPFNPNQPQSPFSPNQPQRPNKPIIPNQPQKPNNPFNPHGPAVNPNQPQNPRQSPQSPFKPFQPHPPNPPNSPKVGPTYSDYGSVPMITDLPKKDHGAPSKNRTTASVVGAAVAGLVIGAIIALFALYRRKQKNNNNGKAGEGSTVKYHNHSGSPW